MGLYDYCTPDLVEMGKLAPNWDGYGGLPIDPETIDNAQGLLAICREFGVGGDATPNPNGTITIEWTDENLGKTFSLEVGKSLISGCVKAV